MSCLVLGRRQHSIQGAIWQTVCRHSEPACQIGRCQARVQPAETDQEQDSVEPVSSSTDRLDDSTPSIEKAIELWSVGGAHRPHTQPLGPRQGEDSDSDSSDI